MGRAKNTSVVLVRVKDRGFMVAVIGVIPTTGLASLADISHPSASSFLFSTLVSTIHGIERERVSKSLIIDECIPKFCIPRT